MHDARTIANRFLTLARESGDTLTPMQVLKLVYIAHGWMLGLHGRPLIDEPVQAWQYGPVIKSLYNAMRHYGGSAVRAPISAPFHDPLTFEELDVINQVYEQYGSFTGPALSRLTHAANTPWAKTYVDGEFGRRISDDIIEDHYRQLSTLQR